MISFAFGGAVRHNHAYRSDIDGLRAVAVCGVVLFHAVPTLLPGGFLGVDVFFVISGFLITRILVRDREAGIFSLIEFYERRIRRILPALAAMVLVVSALAFAVLTPNDLEEYGRSLASMAQFSSNRFFLSRTGYFDPDSGDNLLLHTWSLSIEEQFYLIWPLAISILYGARLKRYAPWLIMLVLIASLARSEWLLASQGGSASFYLFQSRCWELLVGAFLATARLPLIRMRVLREFVSAAALLTIVGCMAFLSEADHFPGVAALAPCLGTAALIHVNRERNTVAARLLSTPIAVSVGLMSYSLYLWHWPALVLPKLVLARSLEPAETFTAVALALSLAWLSWRFIERPFRRSAGKKTARWRVIVIGLAVLVAAWGLGVLARIGDGFPQRAPKAVLQAEAASNSINPFTEHCHVSNAEVPLARICTSPAKGEAGMFVWGDSHAAHMTPLVMAWGERNERVVRQMTKSSCPPLLPSRMPRFMTAECLTFNQRVLQDISGKSAEYIVLAGRWTLYLNPLAEGDEEVAKEILYTALVETVDEIRRQVGEDAEIILIGALPDFSFAPSKCYARARYLRLNTRHCEVSAPSNFLRAVAADEVLTRLSLARPNIRTMLPWRRFCQSGECVTRTKAGDFLFRDDNHLTIDGALFLYDDFDVMLGAGHARSTE